jgi:hypothetical protein
MSKPSKEPCTSLAKAPLSAAERAVCTTKPSRTNREDSLLRRPVECHLACGRTPHPKGGSSSREPREIFRSVRCSAHLCLAPRRPAGPGSLRHLANLRVKRTSTRSANRSPIEPSGESLLFVSLTSPSDSTPVLRYHRPLVACSCRRRCADSLASSIEPRYRRTSASPLAACWRRQSSCSFVRGVV